MWRTALLAGVLVTGLIRPATAAEEIWLRWNGCALDGDAVQLHTCPGIPFDRELRVAATPGAGVSQVVGAIVVIDVVIDAPAVPDWWLMGPTGCRPGALVTDTALPVASSCVDAWRGNGVALLASLGPRQGGAPSDLRIIVTASVPSNQAVSLAADSTYQFAHLTLRTSVNGASGACPGCDLGACLVLNSVQLVRLAGAPGGDITLVQPAPGNGNFALWQSGAGCATVPARNRTWGQIKAIYR